MPSDDNRYRAVLDATGDLEVSGDLDEGADHLLRQDLQTFTGDHALGLRVDLSGVTFFPSAAIAVVVAAQRRAAEHGARLELLAPPASVAGRVLALCGIPCAAPG